MIRLSKTSNSNYYKLLLFLLFWSTKTMAQQPVDLFTGDLKYNIPIMTIPSPDGPPIPLVLNYNAGIGVEQKASMVGLGWSLNTGAINRKVNGVPDDWKGQIHHLSAYGRDKTNNTLTFHKDKISRFYGPLHYREFFEGISLDANYNVIGGASSVSTALKNEFKERTMDTYTSYYPQEASSFEFPDYDEYLISGPGVRGKMKPFLFETNAQLGHYPKLGDKWERPFKNQPYFRMLGEGNSIEAPMVSAANFDRYVEAFKYNISIQKSRNSKEMSFFNLNLDIYGEDDPSKANNYVHFRTSSDPLLVSAAGQMGYQAMTRGVFNINLAQTGSSLLIPNPAYQGAIDANKKPSNSSNIKYYTNQEIVDILTVNTQNTFIEASELTISDRSNLNPSDIGAFSVTNPQGYTYHYSLPEYTLESSQFVIEETDNTNSSITLDSIMKTTKEGYAWTWLLTAITGPNYKDINDDNKVDINDEGYWVKYKYGEWTDEFITQTPYYGTTPLYDENYVAHDYSEIGKRAWYADAISKSQSKTKSTIWYLDYIQTASHTALFVKDIRLDNHSKPTSSSSNPKPLLKLSKVVLMRTEDANTYSWTSNTASLSNSTGFDINGVSKNQVLHSGVYNQNNVNSNHILSSVELDQDYSLCQKYHNNINTIVPTPLMSTNTLLSSADWMETLVDETFLATSYNGQLNQTGKLTLNKIKFYGYQNDDKLPYYEFTYGANPDYNPNRVDYWGFYNSNGSLGGLYENEVNPSEVDAWSLVKISSPFSGITIIEYESDEYEFVGNDRPMRMFKGIDFDIEGFGQHANVSARIDITTQCRDFYNELINPNNIYGQNNVDFIRFRIPFKFQHPIAKIGAPQYRHVTLDQKDYNHSTVMANAWPGNNNPSALMIVPNEDLEGIEVPNLSEIFHGQQHLRPSSLIPDIPALSPDNPYRPSGLSIGLKKAFGGGLRVKSITTKDEDNGGEYKVNYTYEKGAASAEPSLLSPPYGGRLMGNWMLYDRHNYTPNVGYGKITVQSESITSSTNVAGKLKKVYHFYNYNNRHASPVHLTKMMAQGYKSNALNASSFSETDRTTWNNLAQFELFKVDDTKTFYTGKLYKNETLDEFDNVLSVTNTRFKEGNHTAEAFLSVNVSSSQSRYYNVFRTPWGGFPWLQTFYANMVKASVCIKDYRTQILDYQTSYSNGVGSRFEILEHDPLTGIPTKTQNKSMQDVIITERRPAYLDYPAMGMQSIDANNDNFLNSISKQKVYKNDQLMSGYYHLFSKDMPVRKFANGNYSTSVENNKQWFVDKTYVFAGIEDETQWKLATVATLFNEKGNLLETRDDNNRYAATKYGYDDRFQISSLGDGKYGEFTFSSAEDLGANGYFGGEVQKGNNAVVSSSYPHTGYYSLEVPSNNNGFVYNTSTNAGLESGRTYKAQVWLKDNGNDNHTANLSYTYNGPTTSVSKQSTNSIVAGDWVLLTLEIPIPKNTTGTLTVKCESGNGIAYFDDFRFQPLDEPIQTYVYDPVRGKVIAVLDSENFYTRLEYDGLGNVTKTFRETLDGEKQVTETDYNIIPKLD